MSESREGPQPKKSGTRKILMIVGIVLLILTCCFCTTCGGLLYRGHLEKEEMIEARAVELIMNGVPPEEARERAEEELRRSSSGGGDWD